ncbi:hypothetical protein Xmau_03041 [Xenorhabdus mauleonii]|uniref:Uncharacterized protein n=1 Tax=Xenorhabdus mauleonii TaxID=351675 RepID=A0A1I3SC96_9GAMM|nr:hypothetical protein [Xenorhabdus mauleonii]PHM39136.1 hypothetical protein Xmau_03041 [Xenorhabdus mauleonii]SFJ56434.1 hypothetical protein SAMN05421680_11162 [Xenorhabdus mauleonii]
MNIKHYTTTHIINMATALHLDPHDCALPHMIARHLYTLGCAIDDDGSPCDYPTILNQMLESLT